MGAYSRLTIELVMFRVADEDYGVYYCHASTNLGQNYGEVELYGKAFPLLYNLQLLKAYAFWFNLQTVKMTAF